MEIGRRVKNLRRALDVSQEELAARAGLHRNYIGRVERGESDAGITSLMRIAHALGESLATFFEPFRHVPRRRD